MKKGTIFLFAALLLVCILSTIPIAHALDGDGLLNYIKDNWLLMTVISIIITAIAGFLMLSIHNSANNQLAAQRYLTEDGYYKVLDKQEIFERTYETVQRDYYQKKSTSNGGSIKPPK